MYHTFWSKIKKKKHMKIFVGNFYSQLFKGLFFKVKVQNGNFFWRGC